ncbi:MAG: peroxiredoxin family protein [Cellvibrio sp.]
MVDVKKRLKGLKLIALFALNVAGGTHAAEPEPDWGKVSLSSLTHAGATTLVRDNPLVVMFFKPDCKFCKTQSRVMQRIQAQCSAVSFELVGLGARRADLVREVRRYGTSLPAWEASAQFLRLAGNMETTPRTWILPSPEARIVKIRGMMDEPALRRLVAVLAPECGQER